MVDNLGVLQSLVKGISADPDLGVIGHAIHLCLAGNGMSSWFEHVESAANGADGGSRNCDKLASSLNIDLVDAPMLQWPASPLRTKPEEWLQWLKPDE
jgi:hypothetical protein